jgi:hypothetical protein
MVFTAGSVLLPSATSQAIASTFNRTSVAEAKDFAAAAWHDRWDFSNPSDLRKDGPSVKRISNISMRNGVLNYTAGSASYISLLWGGYPGSIRMGRDGALVSNQINAKTFTRVHIHAYVSRKTPAMITYFTKDGFKGLGGMSFLMKAGWNDYDILIHNTVRGGAAWAGRIQGLRLSTNANPAIAVKLDYIRVYAPNLASKVKVVSPNGQAATLYWSSTTARSASRSATSGLALNAGSPVNLSGTRSTTVDLSGYPPGTRFYAVSNYTGAAIGSTLSVVARPTVVIDSPNASGCGDWATAALGHPWRFTSRRDLAGIGDATAVSFKGRVLTAVNAGPIRNDPWVTFPLGNGINGRDWHRLTLVTGYDGAFNLENKAGGGTMGRIQWRIAGQRQVSQTNDLVTYAGKRKIVLDLGMSTAALTEPEAATRYAFASTKHVTLLRWDPNEDRGARRWHVYSIRLARDCATKTTFALQWHDNGYAAGARARVTAVKGTRSYNLGTVSEVAGSNTLRIRAASLPVGKYSIRVTVTNSGSSAVTASDSPLIIAH